MFAPVLAWNASHGWISFKFQFGRVAEGGWSARYIVEFVLAQTLLASPFILFLGGAGFARASRLAPNAPPIALAAALVWPSLLYFCFHALHDRVQGNWPSFLFPAIALLAAFAAAENWSGPTSRRAVRVAGVAAVPVAALILFLVYAQAFFGMIPVRDPVSRLMAFNFEPVAAKIENVARDRHAPAIATASYATTAWLSFYLKPRIPIVQINEDFRWLSAPKAQPFPQSAPLLFVTQHPKNGGSLPDAVRRLSMHYLTSIDRRRHGVLIERYDVYSVQGWTGGALGREP
jgi:hypothetical protein